MAETYDPAPFSDADREFLHRHGLDDQTTAERNWREGPEWDL
jgi:hypothetical protein